MSKLIIVGHGAYATAVKQSLEMLLGKIEGLFYIDFTQQDNADTLSAKLKSALELCHGDAALFACDLAGGTPFRQCCTLCEENPECITVSGLNMPAYCEMVYNLHLPVTELCDLAIDVVKNTITRFPEITR